MELARMEVEERAARQFTGALIPAGSTQGSSFCMAGIRAGVLHSAPRARKAAENASHFKHFFF